MGKKKKQKTAYSKLSKCGAQFLDFTLYQLDVIVLCVLDKVGTQESRVKERLIRVESAHFTTQ